MSIVNGRSSSISSAGDKGPFMEDYSAYSVEELFQKFSIKDIQGVNQRYKQDALTAKHQLQNLVSEKYRDLISISDGIDEKCQRLELSLSNFAFKPANFVKFNSDSYSKLSYSMISEEHQQLKTAQKLTVLNDMIYDVLLGFDLKLQKRKFHQSPVVHTSKLIYYSKVYFTLESNFKNEIKSNSLLNSCFHSMKQNFNDFLKEQISCFNKSSNSFIQDSDKFEANQSFDINNIFSKTSLNLMDENEEFELDESVGESNDNPVDYVGELTETYDSNTLPIINYLVSYIILNTEGSSVSRSSVLFEFLQFRFDYLSSILTSMHVDSTNYDRVNFLNIFVFIENTFGYAANYFENQDFKNGLVKQLTKVTRNWSLGFDQYHNSKTSQRFNIDPITVKLPPSSLKDLKDVKRKFVDLIVSFFKELPVDKTVEVKASIHNLVFFKNLLISVKRIDIQCSELGFKSQITRLIAEDDENILVKILSMIISNVEESYKNHLSLISDKKDISLYGILTRGLSRTLPQSSTKEMSLFTTEFVDLISSNLTQYSDLITEASRNPTFSFRGPEEDVTKSIEGWFENNTKFLLLLETKEEPKFKFDLVELTSYLAKPLDETGVEVQWGKFSRKRMMDEFSGLTASLEKMFWTNIDEFICRISTLASENIEGKNIANIYAITKCLIMLKQNILLSTDDKVTVNERVDKINAGIEQCSNYIVETIPTLVDESSISFFDQFEAVFESILNTEESAIENFPSTPSLKLSALMFHLSTQFMNPNSSSYEKDYQNGILFIDNNNNIFANKKNEFINNILIPKAYEVILGKDIKLSKALAHLIYSNIVYLACFTSNTPNVPLDEIKSIADFEINDIDFKEISKSILEFYTASKNSYYPLNA
ncbi:hypothetical protein PSN45_001811 [Yamadazyma tenuis]|uniref:Uncharacterized protein n=1 Tax=Candida tenuis (strain ATCC 10573 / BCRC 21748 / CBS 615 / JCM 9827 / NBRC 10315 / NRRL Y-1498 / VKM Y-70) TaxID=590646 RepID=G3BE07_CANTC|nr:uncharacterized protein CANTEDRAFT_95879 [Yamadazyma tenuis ATCC 10573]EGV60427.1 hypothetical protein CANTEDRAFT_95879 [Yamadazyma tenuis ATCC 10573]WEJ94327.1 hypothetical protein PSN45_001811 [Yamadazyma tenuis]